MRRGLLDRLFAVLIREAELPDDDLVVDARLVDVAEHFRRPVRAGPRVGVGQRVISTTTMSPGCASSCSSDGIWTSMMSRRSNGTTNPMPDPVDVEAADDRLGAALEDADDASLGPVVASTRSIRATTRSPCIAWFRLLPAM